MALYRKPDSKFWWADVTVAGQPRLRISTKKTVKTHAAQVEASLIHKLSVGEISAIRQKAPLLSELAPRFLDHIEKCRLDEDTKAYYRNGWRMLKGQDISRLRVDKITTSDAATVTTSGSGSNVNCALRTLRRMLSLAEEWKLLLRKPRIRLEDETKRERVIRPDEELLFLSKANATMRDVFLLMMDTGVRPSEAAVLDWEAVNFVDGSIFIRKGKTPKARRTLSMTDRVRTMLIARASNGSPWVFPSKRFAGKHVKPKSISIMASALKKQLGLPADLVLYCARHTFGTDFQSGNGDLAKTSKAMGHEALSTTARYLHPDLAHQAKIMNERNKLRHVSSHSALATQSVQ